MSCHVISLYCRAASCQHEIFRDRTDAYCCISMLRLIMPCSYHLEMKCDTITKIVSSTCWCECVI